MSRILWSIVLLFLIGGLFIMTKKSFESFQNEKPFYTWDPDFVSVADRDPFRLWEKEYWLDRVQVLPPNTIEQRTLSDLFLNKEGNYTGGFFVYTLQFSILSSVVEDSSFSVRICYMDAEHEIQYYPSVRDWNSIRVSPTTSPNRVVTYLVSTRIEFRSIVSVRLWNTSQNTTFIFNNVYITKQQFWSESSSSPLVQECYQCVSVFPLTLSPSRPTMIPSSSMVNYNSDILLQCTIDNSIASINSNRNIMVGVSVVIPPTVSSPITSYAVRLYLSDSKGSVDTMKTYCDMNISRVQTTFVFDVSLSLTALSYHQLFVAFDTLDHQNLPFPFQMKYIYIRNHRGEYQLVQNISLSRSVSTLLCNLPSTFLSTQWISPLPVDRRVSPPPPFTFFPLLNWQYSAEVSPLQCENLDIAYGMALIGGFLAVSEFSSINYVLKGDIDIMFFISKTSCAVQYDTFRSNFPFQLQLGTCFYFILEVVQRHIQLRIYQNQMSFVFSSTIPSLPPQKYSMVNQWYNLSTLNRIVMGSSSSIPVLWFQHTFYVNWRDLQYFNNQSAFNTASAGFVSPFFSSNDSNMVNYHRQLGNFPLLPPGPERIAFFNTPVLYRNTTIPYTQTLSFPVFLYNFSLQQTFQYTTMPLTANGSTLQIELLSLSDVNGNALVTILLQIMVISQTPNVSILLQSSSVASPIRLFSNVPYSTSSFPSFFGYQLYGIYDTLYFIPKSPARRTMTTTTPPIQKYKMAMTNVPIFSFRQNSINTASLVKPFDFQSNSLTIASSVLLPSSLPSLSSSSTSFSINNRDISSILLDPPRIFSS